MNEDRKLGVHIHELIPLVPDDEMIMEIHASNNVRHGDVSLGVMHVKIRTINPLTRVTKLYIGVHGPKLVLRDQETPERTHLF